MLRSLKSTRTMCWLCAILTSLLILTAMIPNRVQAGTATTADGREVEDDGKYDRLDGKGPSGKHVDVVEWEGNLEIHVAPKGSLRGLALKLDKKNKDKPVMVIGYRFVDSPTTQLIRRAILGIPINEKFKTFIDPTEPDYDKVIITNNGLASPLVAYKLEPEPEPKQLYPEGHPALAQASDASKPTAEASRTPAEVAKRKKERAKKEAADLQDSGTIRPFFGSGGGSDE